MRPELVMNPSGRQLQRLADADACGHAWAALVVSNDHQLVNMHGWKQWFGLTLAGTPLE